MFLAEVNKIKPQGWTSDQVLGAFLCKGSDLNHGGANVAWGKVCLPKEEGGLGIKIF